MHLACRYGSPHNAVRLVQPRRSWLPVLRLFCTSSQRSRYHHDAPRSANLLGSYIPKPAPNPQAKDIAILGGGISGLATAFNLTRDIPNAKITIFESKDKIGGWVDSEQVEVDDGTVLFEWGPRTLRPDFNGSGIATLQLINELKEDLAKSIRGVPFSSPAATNRYIYYPDHLVRMPAPNPESGVLSNLFNNARTFFTEPAFKGILGSLITEPTVVCRANNVRDESVGSFIRRRFGTAVTDNLLSALFHGIYAGDIYKLSARTLMPYLWYLENRDPDSNGVIPELMEISFRGHRLMSFDKIRFGNRLERVEKHGAMDLLLHQMRQTSVYSFVKGIGQLTDTLVDELRQNPNVTIETGSSIASLKFDNSNRKFEIAATQTGTPKNFDYTICTFSPNKLHDVLSSAGENKALTKALSRNGRGFPSVNVMVVNLYYKSEALPHPSGFGYLIPRSVAIDQNPERALGVIFSSETAGPKGQNATGVVYDDMPKVIEEQQRRFPNNQPSLEDYKQFQKDMEQYSKETIQIGQDTASGTKLAVMLGGHWWDGWAESDLPSESEGIEMAKSVISRHLGITETPIVAKARMQRDCIPQYQVGYRDEMANIHRELVGKDGFEGRLKVTGTWWQGGVGFNDCVKAAKETSRRIREAWDDDTGLEGYVGEEKWVLIDRRTGIQVMDPLQK